MPNTPLGRTTQKFVSLAGAALLLMAAGCHHKAKKTPYVPAAAGVTPTATISSTPNAVDRGDAVVLVWRTTDATEVSIDGIGPVNPNDQKMVQPQVTTTYHLTAKGDGGEAGADVTVTVNAGAAVAPPTPPPADTGSMTATDLSATDDSAFHAAVGDVYFDYDSYDVRPDAASTMAQDAAWFNAHPGAKVIVGGYCDSRGSTEYNIALGENRANAAKAALVKSGVNASRIRVVSYGKEKQFCTDETEACWQQNRRAAFNLDK